MKKLIIALVAVLLIEAGLAAQSPAFTIISPSVNVTATPSNMVSSNGDVLSTFTVNSRFSLVDYRNLSSCTFSWYFGDEVAPAVAQTMGIGVCTPDLLTAGGANCSTVFRHTYKSEGQYHYQAGSVSCKPYPTLLSSVTGASGFINVACPPLFLGSCGFTTACVEAPLPPADQGKPYSYNFTTRTSGGKPTLNFSSTSTLPPGLTLSSSGLLSGTPSASGPFSLSVQVTDSCTSFSPKIGTYQSPQTASKGFGIAINPCPPITLTSASPLPVATVGAPYSFTFSGTGMAPIQFRARNAGGIVQDIWFYTPPPGLTWNGTTGTLSGTPTTPGNYSLVAQAIDSCTPRGYSNSPTYALQVQCPLFGITSSRQLQNAMIGQPYSQQITQAGGQLPVVFTIAQGALPPGLSLSADGLISGTPTQAGNYQFIVNGTDSCPLGARTIQRSFALTVACTQLSIPATSLAGGTVGQVYADQVDAVGGQSPYTFSLESGLLPPGLGLSPAGAVTGTPRVGTEGLHRFTVAVQDSCVVGSQFARNTLTIDIAPRPFVCPSFVMTSPSSLTNATAGRPYSVQLRTFGGMAPVGFSISSGSLPSGLAMTPEGLISGVPSVPGTYSFSVSATDSCTTGARTLQQTYTLQVLSPPVVCSPVSIVSLSPLPGGSVNQAYAYQLVTSGGQPPLNFAVTGSLPPGLAMTPEGLISGVPSAPGTHSFSVTVTDSCPTGASTATQAYTMQVLAAPVVCPKLNMISQSPLPIGRVNQVYTQQLVTSGGQPPVTFTIAGGSLPQGLNLTPSGLITGLPSESGNFSVSIRAQDSCPGSVQAVQSLFTLQIDALPPPQTFVVAASPASLAVPRGTSSVGQVTYTLTGGPSMSGVMTSPLGNFIVGGEVVGTNPMPVTVTMTAGYAVITEQVLVPVTVIERALQRGSAIITYQREFTGQGGATATAAVSLNVTTEAAAGFAIKRMDLYFANRRPEVTVPRLSHDIKAFVEIDYTGTGPLEGFWEVDDRVIAFVSRPVTFGTTLVLESPQPPTLPTSNTGVHLMRFVVTSPATDLPMPVGTYFVTPEEAVTRTTLKLKSPEDKAVIDYSSQKFMWESGSPVAAYQIIFQAQGEKDPVFSAFVKDSSYHLSGTMLKGRFSAGRTVSWKVQAFDAGGNLTGESKAREFTFETPRGYVPGQILVALEDKAYSDQIMAELAEKYRLKAVETFDLKSILMKLTVFETSEKDIFKIIAEMKKDNRVQLVQPNYVMMTHAAGPKVSQYADTVIRLERISPSLKGRGVRIALIDTGVDSSHADLKGKISAARNFVGPEGYRAEIHGTAVAGIISGSGIGVKGISPEAEILALRACRQTLDDAPEAECFTTSLSKAIDDAIRSDAKVINMSFGAVQNDPLLTRLISAGAEKEIIFVAPAGNAAGEHELRFPASHPAVVAVGGFDDRNRPYPNGDIVKKASVSAPAVDVFTTVPGGRYNFLTGTSLSAGYVSGLIALAAERDHALTKAGLPLYHGDFCRWEEELLKISLCGK